MKFSIIFFSWSLLSFFGYLISKKNNKNLFLLVMNKIFVLIFLLSFVLAIIDIFIIDIKSILINYFLSISL